MMLLKAFVPKTHTYLHYFFLVGRVSEPLLPHALPTVFSGTDGGPGFDLPNSLEQTILNWNAIPGRSLSIVASRTFAGKTPMDPHSRGAADDEDEEHEAPGPFSRASNL